MQFQSLASSGQTKILCELKQQGSNTTQGGDGLTVDTLGNLYITSALGIQVFSQSGKLLGIIELPDSGQCDVWWP